MALASVGVGACGAGNGGTDTSGGGEGVKIPAFAKDFKPPASGCGSFSAKAPADPDGVIADLDAEHKEALGGYTDFGSTAKVQRSAWADWKPKHPGPYKIAISFSQLVNDFQFQMVDQLKKRFGEDKNVSKVTLTTTGAQVDVGQQLQQFNQLVQTKPDLMLLLTPSADSFVAPVERAQERGIPTITLLGPVPSDAAVNVDENNYLAAAETASYVTRLLDGKGNFVKLRALAAAAADRQANAAWEAVVKSCPGMKIGGEVYGGFSESVAKSEVLKYLATHPEKIDAWGMFAGMSQGALKALVQSGRPVPPIAEVGLERGLLGYWSENQGAFHAASAGAPPVPMARAMHEIAMRMLAGQGLKLNTVVGKAVFVNDANLKDWTVPGETLDSPGTGAGEPQDFLPSTYLESFFARPAPIEP